MPSFQSLRGKDIFIHEIRTALTVAKVQVQLLARRHWSLDAPEQQRLTQGLAIANDAVDRASQHVAELNEDADLGSDQIMDDV